MILYFTDRTMQIVDLASTGLVKGKTILDDNRVQEVETGVTTFECTIPFRGEDRAKVEEMTAVGNYIIRHNDDGDEFYTIIQTELDSEAQEMYLYAEDAGLDLLNEVVPKFPDAEMGDDDSDSFQATIDWYMNKWLQDTGFEIGINEIDSSIKKKLSAAESTLMERVREISGLFEAEIGFSFVIERMAITKKYLNIYKKRGKSLNKKLYLDREIKRIIVKTSIENIATALQVVGGDASGIPVTLDNYTYDDGDFYLGDRKDYPSTTGKKKLLYSRKARGRWSRYAFGGEPGKLANGTGDIIKVFRSDLTDKKALCEAAVAELTKAREPEINYEVEFHELPQDVSIGDIVDIIDEYGELYLSSRILKLEESVANDTRTATLGEYLIQSGGISQQVLDLAEQFQKLSESRTLYTWIVYADDAEGTGISTEPEGKAYIGVSANHFGEEPDLSDPSLYSFSLAKGEDGADGEDAIILRIDSSRGIVFKNDRFDTVLSVVIIKGSLTITDFATLRTHFGSGAYLQWMCRGPDDEDFKIMSASDSRISDNGFKMTITPSDVDRQIVFYCDLII